MAVYKKYVNGAWVTQSTTFPVKIGGGAELPFIIPAQYGAVGDGETDDTDALGEMFTAAYGSDTPIMFAAGKTYVVTGPICYLDTGTDIPMVIYGNGATIKHANSSAHTMFSLIALDCDVVVRDLTIEASLDQSGDAAHAGDGTITNRSNVNGFAIRVPRKIYAENCIFDGLDSAIVGSKRTGAQTQGIEGVLNSIAVKGTLFGLSQYWHTLKCSNSRFAMSDYGKSGEHAVYILGDALEYADFSGCTFVGNSASNAAAQIYSGTAPATAPVVRFDGCTFYGVGYIHISNDVDAVARSCTFVCSDAANANGIRPFTAGMKVYNSDVQVTAPFDIYCNFINCSIKSVSTSTERYVGEYRNCDITDIGFSNANLLGCRIKNTKQIPGRYLISGANGAKCAVTDCIWDCANANAANIFYNSGNVTECAVIANLTVLNPTAQFATTSNAKVFYSGVTLVTPTFAD